MRYTLKDSKIIEFSTEVVKITGSVHTALIFSVIDKLVGDEGELSAEEIASELNLQNRNAASIRNKFNILDFYGLVSYTKGSRFHKAHFKILQRFKADTDIDLKWRYRSSLSYTKTWILTSLENQGQPVRVKELHEIHLETLTSFDISRILTELKRDGLVDHARWVCPEDGRAGMWCLAQEYLPKEESK
ncbi:hypothetical protein PDK35_02525 [Bacillus cereus group sp. TH153LC]|uniref:hypothetical protein n=1 Tax=Bacillus cereus group sp. TH153LC TaxID=3018059 RepID=UPI0022DFDB46|nr:hypothetical protein [Bacillus cereus group sp. TH153LC]MDA1658851.1 hypothetical protein [Bacillus cereus group sp. TH153LC]